MEIDLNIKLKLPDECEGMTDRELRELIYDEYINFVPCQHFYMAIEFGAKGMIGTENETKSLCEISKYHTMWGHLTAQPKFEIKRVIENAKESKEGDK